MLRLLLALPALALLPCCGTMNTIKEGTSEGLSAVGEGFGKGIAKVGEVATSPFRPGVPVVEAREDALEEVPSGRDKALAYERRQRFWIFGPPVDFEEPALPEESALGDGGLLPPLEDS